MSKPAVTDSNARHVAVEPQRSVIVQAPAGSGKTTLLVERYLRLLAIAEAPEEILAITFTRKAAAEMRQRVLRLLDPATTSSAAHEQRPLELARSIADKVGQWQLRENPQRLLIRTIDSFNHYLARTMPVASQLGPVPSPADNAKSYYRQAARTVLALVDAKDDLAPHLNRVLEWRDHRSQDIEDLIADLLGRRDQWLRALDNAGGAQRSHLQAVLESIVSGHLRRASEALDRALADIDVSAQSLLGLLQFAASNLTAASKDSALRIFQQAPSLPNADPRSLPQWVGLAEGLLTREGKFRNPGGVKVTLGFPPKTDEKAAFVQLLLDLSEDQTLRQALHQARNLPNPQYSDKEWAVLESLVQVLVRAATELELIFARTGQTDYTGLAAAALRGLGDEEQGITDLGLYLDRRIRHILVDEFQDTNWSQLHLLEKLTAGWEPDDGRSVFLVGDPMQSIYRFREAEVGLFIRSREQGVGHLQLESSQLQRNFRSRKEIVSWVNDHLGPIFPRVEDISAGAVAYASSEAGRGEGGEVSILSSADEQAEAEAISELLLDALARNAADYKIAIIVRARSHLRGILPALNHHGIAYRAVKLDPLTSKMVVQDLLAITRAITTPSDIAALLAMLRAPTCGLTLAQLQVLAGDGRSPLSANAVARLDAEGKERAGKVFDALAAAQAQWRRRSTAELVAGVWQRLGGPNCCLQPETELRDAQIYLDALEQAESSGLLEDWNDFLERLDGEFTEGDPASASVQVEVLTMHGAKGLEWDLVVLPGLNKAPPRSDSPLLYWLPLTQADGTEQVLLAPLRSAETATNPALVEMIRREQQQRAAYENQRLLYVATTRAKERLVLSAQIDPEKEEFRPTSGSLLADLWPTTEHDFISAQAEPTVQQSSATPAAATMLDQSLRKVRADWQPPMATRLAWNSVLPAVQRDGEVEYDWAGREARVTGTVLHRLLERVGNVGIEAFGTEQRQRLIGRIPLLLKSMGTQEEQLADTSEMIEQAFTNTLNSDVGQWLLSAKHTQSACELPVSGVLEGQLVNAVLDRTFIDADGIRWIVDYKSGYRAGGDLSGFFRQEAQRYREQLERYQQLLSQLGPEPIQAALFLPRHTHLEVL
ncbi:MAG: UvrD-helicase domain-containing protein [Pseudomonadales bacterium]